MKEVEQTFIEKTLTPEIFWSATGSIGTMIGVLVALFYPICQRYFRINRIIHIIENEIKENKNKIYAIANAQDIEDGNGGIINVRSQNIAMQRHLQFPMWDQYKHEIASERPYEYERLKSIMKLGENVRDYDIYNNHPSLGAQINDAKLYVEKCDEVLRS